MTHLRDLLDARRDELLSSFARSLSEGDGAPPDPTAAKQRFDEVAEELARGLRGQGSAPVATPPGEPEGPPGERAGGPDAAMRSAALTRALGDLHVRIVEMAAEAGVEVSPPELAIVAVKMNSEMARAAAGIEREHDRRMRRVAHQLRNPLGSALLALTLLRSKVELGESARLADMIERNLHRLQSLIDESVGEA